MDGWKKQHLWVIVSNKMYILKNDNKKNVKKAIISYHHAMFAHFYLWNYWAIWQKKHFQKQIDYYALA